MLSPHRVTKGATIAVVLGAIAAPAASARPARMAPRGAAVVPSQALGHRNQGAPVSAPGTRSLVYSRQNKELTPALPSGTGGAAVPTATTNDGFDWGDAGIGAAGGLVLSIVGIGGALTLSQRRTRRSGASAATAS